MFFVDESAGPVIRGWAQQMLYGYASIIEMTAMCCLLWLVVLRAKLPMLGVMPSIKIGQAFLP